MSVRVTDLATRAVPQLTLESRTGAAELRLFARDLGGGVVDVVVAAAGRALRAHPAACVNVVERDGLAVPVSVEPAVSVAVSTDHGVLFPVVRNAATASLPDVRSESARVVAAARAGIVEDGDHGGAAMTVSFLDVGLAPLPAVVEPPQASVLVVAADEADAVSLTLSVDTRALGRAAAERLLASVARLVERPYRRLV